MISACIFRVNKGRKFTQAMYTRYLLSLSMRTTKAYFEGSETVCSTLGNEAFVIKDSDTLNSIINLIDSNKANDSKELMLEYRTLKEIARKKWDFEKYNYYIMFDVYIFI